MARLFVRNSDPSGQRRARPAWSRLPSPRALFLLWLPAALIAAAILLPILYLIIRASSGGISAWVHILRPSTLAVLGRTALLGVSVTGLSVALALPLAWLTQRTDLPGHKLWALITPLPLVVPSYVGAYLFASALGPRGLLQGWLEQPFGITRLPDLYGFPGSLLVLTLLNYPFVLLSLRAALQRMDPALEEAARSLGQSAWGTFWKITFPQLRPAMTAGGLLVLLYVLRDFGAVSVMRYNTFTRVIYVQYQNSFDRSAAAALSILLVALSLVVLLAEMRWRGRSTHHNAARTPKKSKRLPLGAWRWPALIFCGLIIGLALLLPAGILLYWLARGLGSGEQIVSLWQASRNSIVASTMAALLAVAASLPVVILDVRRPSRGSRVLERISYLAFALPGIVVALALVFFGANFAPWIYQTLPMLGLAYLILFLPQAIGAVRTSMLQAHPSMEEAARSLGKSPPEVFRRITLPLVRPGIAAAAALVFLSTMKELPVTLILAPIGFKTLATSVWSSVSEAFFAQAAAPALLLIVASSLPMAILVSRESSPG
ncbi:MAG: iron ABC transporter permease [Chloroflexi bacterium]|nr:iron ABC transporter permease [Chloroflexota bacterium]MQC26007.1 iron ABC transporter permease [Chloroflexota bacterium]